MTGQGLKNSVMFAIDGENTYAALSLAHDKFTCHDQRLFIGYRHILPSADGRKRWCQPCSAHNGRKDKINLRQAGNRTCPVGSLKHLYPEVRGSLPQLLGSLQVEHRDIRWLETPHLLLEQFNITTGRKSHDGEPLRMLLDDLQGIDPDGTG